MFTLISSLKLTQEEWSKGEGSSTGGTGCPEVQSQLSEHGRLPV